MTTLREAATMALEAMEYSGMNVGKFNRINAACQALRAALAEPVQEPVAWTYEWKHRLHGGSLNVSRARWPESHLWIETPLYAAPPQPAEPVEPVAWIQPDHLQKARKAPFLCRVEPTKRMVDFVALYTAPPQRKPLSNVDLAKIWDDALDQLDPRDQLRFVARAIERAHGIGSQP